MLNKSVGIFIIASIVSPFMAACSVAFHVVMFSARKLRQHSRRLAGRPSRSAQRAYRARLHRIADELEAGAR